MKRNIFLGFIKLHLLHHAGQSPIFGLDMIKELASHGYELSPGTLYPILHGLERDGYLKVESITEQGRVRKYYTLTKRGESALKQGRKQAAELLKEISE